MPRKSNSLFYVGGSVLLIMIAIAATAIVGQTKPDNTGAADIRAKAGVTATLKALVTVNSVDINRGTITVDNLRFVESTGEISSKNLGSWIVTPPPGFNLATLFPGATLTITISPQTFLATSHTVTATQIMVER